MNNEVVQKIEAALKDFKAGKMVVVVDDKNRENEGDLIFAGEKATAQKVNFMAKEGRGLICAPISGGIAKKLDLQQMVCDNSEKFSTAFTVSLDAKKEISTGISASDRALTLKKLADPKSKKGDFVFPGHIFPLRSAKEGVISRPGHTEAAVDLCKLTNQRPVAAVCEIMKEDGTMAHDKDLKAFSKKHNLKIISIDQLISYRRRTEKLMCCLAKAKLPTKYGLFKIIAFESVVDKLQHVAIVKGDTRNHQKILTRIHSECLTGDALFSDRCDCRSQLEKSFELISKKKNGIIIYLRQEGRGIGLLNKIRAYGLQDKGLNTVEANEKLGFPPDLREYSIAAGILRELEVKSIELLTNNPKKIKELALLGVKVENRIPIQTTPTPDNIKYLKTKQKEMGHLFNHLND